MDEQQRPVSPDGRYEWDGSNWVPRAQPPAEGQNPYGQNPYGQNPYGQSPYGAPAYPQAGQPAYGASTNGGLAGFGQRLAAYLVDVAVVLPLYVVGAVGEALGADPADGGAGAGGVWLLVGLLAYLAAAAVSIYNLVFRQGRTGWSWGKQVMGIRLVGDASRQPIGAGRSFLRQLAHIIDAIPCYVGYLLPLFTAKKQTIADMVMKTVVVEQRKG